MRIVIATSPAKPREPNEDFAAATANGAVLIDGAGLSGTPSECTRGVAWYARHLGGALLAGLPDENRSLTDILAGAIADTASLHAEACQLDDPGTPSSTVIVIRTVNDGLQYLVLADSVLVIRHRDGQVEAISDDREAVVGAAYRGAMDALPNGTPEHDAARQAYIEAMRAHRNRPGGFWVAAADPGAASEAVTGERLLADLRDVLLLSDGASRITDLFGLTTWTETCELAASRGPDAVIAQVREAEGTDPRGVRWPRAKAHDDATALYCMI